MSMSTSASSSESSTSYNTDTISSRFGSFEEKKELIRTNDYPSLIWVGSGAKANKGFDEKTSSILSDPIYADELKRNDAITVNFGANTPTNFPIDRKQAFLMRIKSFAAGAELALHPAAPQQAEVKERLLPMKGIRDLVTKYTEYLNSIQDPQKLKKNTYTVELHNFQQELCALTGLSEEDLALAEAMHVWQHEQPPTHVTKFAHHVTESARDDLTITQIDFPVHAHLTDFQKQEILKIFDPNPPTWFTDLPSWAQDFIKNDVLGSKDNPNWDNYEKNMPSTVRKLPGQANATRHELFITDAKEHVLSHTTTYRQAVPTAFQMSSTQDRQNSAIGNLEQMLAYACTDEAKIAFYNHWGINADEAKDYSCPVFVGGLLTHSSQAHGIYNLFEFTTLGSENNTKMVNEQQAAFYDYLRTPPPGFRFYNLNIAVNKQRDVSVIGMRGKEEALLRDMQQLHTQLLHKLSSTHDGESLDQLAQSLRPDRRLSIPQQHLLHLTDALRAVDATRGTKLQSGRNKNLFLAAQYELLVRASGGIPLRNCKSSKDRAGVTMMMADAMEIYYRTYGDYPKYNDKADARNNFIAIFKELYASGHQQYEANYNSPGAAGIKDEGILDKDIKEALGDVYNYSVELGELNKPGTFFQKYVSYFNYGFLFFGLGLGAFAGTLAATGTFAPFTGLSTSPAAAFFINFGMALGMVGLLYLTVRLLDKFFPSDTTFANKQENVKSKTKRQRNKKIALGLGAGIGVGLGLVAFFLMPNLAATVMAQLGIYSVLFSGLIFGAVGYGIGAILARDKASYSALLIGLLALGTGIYLTSAGIIPTMYAATALTVLTPVLPCILVMMLFTRIFTRTQPTLKSAVEMSAAPPTIADVSGRDFMHGPAPTLSASMSQNASMSAVAESNTTNANNSASEGMRQRIPTVDVHNSNAPTA